MVNKKILALEFSKLVERIVETKDSVKRQKTAQIGIRLHALQYFA
jgi:hypothetical protein